MQKTDGFKEGEFGRMLTPSHFEAVGQYSSSDDRPAGTAGYVWLCNEFNHLTGITLSFRVVRYHLVNVHKQKQWAVTIPVRMQFPKRSLIANVERPLSIMIESTD